MTARHEPFAGKDRFGRARGRNNDIRILDRLAWVRHRSYFNVQVASHLIAELFAFWEAPAKHIDAGYGPYSTDAHQLYGGLFPRANQTDNGCIGTGQVVGSQGATSARPHRPHPFSFDGSKQTTILNTKEHYHVAHTSAEYGVRLMTHDAQRGNGGCQQVHNAVCLGETRARPIRCLPLCQRDKCLL